MRVSVLICVHVVCMCECVCTICVCVRVHVCVRERESVFSLFLPLFWGWGACVCWGGVCVCPLSSKIGDLLFLLERAGAMTVFCYSTPRYHSPCCSLPKKRKDKCQLLALNQEGLFDN